MTARTAGTVAGARSAPARCTARWPPRWAALRARGPTASPRVLDVGGGSGAWAVPLARSGCAVTVVDNSPNALAALQRRARDAGVDELVTRRAGRRGRARRVVPPGGADLVLGHGLLEVVDDAAAAVAALAAAAAPGWGGVGAGRGPVRGGARPDPRRPAAEARALLTDPDGRFGPDDALRRRLDAATLRALLEAAAGCGSSCCRATASSSAGCRARCATAARPPRGRSAELEELAAGGPRAARGRRPAARRGAASGLISTADGDRAALPGRSGGRGPIDDHRLRPVHRGAAGR